jgi:O-antigen/teichoic acid export membrane protein
MTRAWRTLRAVVTQPPELTVRVGFNGLAQLAPLVVVLAITPLLLSRLGLDRYGIWALALVAVNTLRLVDGGIAGSLARFYAVYAARDAREAAGRLLVGSFVGLAAIGLVFSLVMFPLAPTLVGLLDVPPGIEGEAAVVFRWVPALATLLLMGESTSALLVGHGMFRALAATMWTSAGAFALAVVVFVDPGADLETLMLATGGRYIVLVAANLTVAARHLSLRWPFLPSRATVREVAGYSSRMQLSALTGFVNTELNGLVIAALLPVRYVGLYQIGVQVASAARSLPLYAFPPLLTRITTIFGLEGRGEAAAEFERLERRWLPAVLGYGVVATVAVAFSVPIWLGDRYVLSGGVAAILLAGYTAHVGLTGMRTCYVRAVGRPGLELRSSVAWAVVNAILAVPLALLLGLLGVVSATAVGGILASVYFVALCRATERLPAIRLDRSWWIMGAVAAALTVAGELAIVYADVHGFLALMLSGLPALVAWATFAGGLRRARRGRSRAPATLAASGSPFRSPL